MEREGVIVLGAGVTGLAAGLVSGLSVYEAAEHAGGICSSYYIRPGADERLHTAPNDGEAYRFEIGGGHWIFGVDPVILHFIDQLTPVKSYTRCSGVYFSKEDLCVPYPLQNHLNYLGNEVATKALVEMASVSRTTPRTMAEWIERSFGPTLTSLFFAPFHELYTAGLWTCIAPQDAYKSPVNFVHAVQGALGQAPPVGYNAKFVYPKEGLDALARRMAERCQVYYGKRVIHIDIGTKEVQFSDGAKIHYDNLISTLPLNKIMEMTNLEVDIVPYPYTSVLVLNIGATRGVRMPEEQWLYIPDSKAGFHRVGFYSNVDVSFLPASSRDSEDRVSIYVERAYSGAPPQDEEEVYRQAVVTELQDWGFIGEAEVVDPTWIDVAYTWTWPESRWKQQVFKNLEKYGIYQIGRYARWKFQGISESIRDGFFVGGRFSQ